MSFRLYYFGSEVGLRDIIRSCQKDNHVQQVAYSTYHDCLTHICFTCKQINTSMKYKDTEVAGDKPK